MKAILYASIIKNGREWISTEKREWNELYYVRWRNVEYWISGIVVVFITESQTYCILTVASPLGRAFNIFLLLILIRILDFPPYSFLLMYERANFYDLIPDVNIVVAHSKWQEEGWKYTRKLRMEVDPKSTGAAFSC